MPAKMTFPHRRLRGSLESTHEVFPVAIVAAPPPLGPGVGTGFGDTLLGAGPGLFALRFECFALMSCAW